MSATFVSLEMWKPTQLWKLVLSHLQKTTQRSRNNNNDTNWYVNPGYNSYNNEGCCNKGRNQMRWICNKLE